MRIKVNLNDYDEDIRLTITGSPGDEKQSVSFMRVSVHLPRAAAIRLRNALTKALSNKGGDRRQGV
jgi:hypothetical protein